MKIARFWILLTVLACGLVAAATPPLQARQQPPAQPRQTPTPRATPATPEELQETTTTRAVRVPVTVLDKKGKPVTGLTKNDFLVFEDKRPIEFDFLGESQEIEKQPIYIAIWQFCDEKMRSVGSTRRALVVITDGDDTYSRARIEDAIGIAQKTDTIIFAISTKGGFTGSAVPGVEAGTVKDSGDKELDRMAQETGGHAFFTGDMLALERAFKKIGEELRSQYRITYKPDPPFDGRYRRIEVRVAAGGGYKVNAKHGYYADSDMIRK